MGKAGKWFPPEEAMDYVAGYVIFNDITARDIQRREMRSGVFSFCKAIDTFCPLGPWIVTPDEIPDPHDLAMELRVNGESRQTSHSGNMATTIPEILSPLLGARLLGRRRALDRHRGGVAGFSEDAASLYLKPGDVIEAEIERIGVLRNPVDRLAGGARQPRAAARALVNHPSWLHSGRRSSPGSPARTVPTSRRSCSRRATASSEWSGARARSTHPGSTTSSRRSSSCSATSPMRRS